MQVQNFYLNSDKEVIVKIVREVLNLFKIQIVAEAASPDYRELSIENERLAGEVPRVRTSLCVVGMDGSQQSFCEESVAHGDEREGAAVHRLIKLNLYHLFRQNFSLPPAPWGIMHGVRPTKIVHRLIASGLAKDAAMARLMADYETSRKKAECITRLAFRQLPFLAQSDEHTVSIYVGIPFCLSRCLYCSFPSNILPGRDVLDRFMAAWKKDLAAVVAAVEKYHFHVQNIYIGGGTPTSLPDEYFAEMLHMVYNAFYGPGVAEFTVEAGRPDSMSPAKIQAMQECRVDRVSANPQTMQLRTLQRIGRQHTPEDIVQMFNDLRAAGIPSINMDLIVGLPGENAVDMADTMQKVIALHPDDITLHALALKRGSRLKLQLDEEGSIEIPDDTTVQQMFQVAMDYVEQAGLAPYYLYRQGYMSGQLENVGCCRPGGEGMYNIQIMEEHQTILGIGGAATTKVVDFRAGRLKSAFNAKDLMTYLNDIDIYIEKRALLLEAAYGNGEGFSSC